MVTASPVSNNSAAIEKQRTTFGGIFGRRHGLFAPLKHAVVVMKRLDIRNEFVSSLNFLVEPLVGFFKKNQSLLGINAPGILRTARNY